MTKEELKQEAEEYALNQWEGNLPWSVIQKSYYDGALPREKQIQIDAEQIRVLQKQNGELTDELTKKSDTNHQLIEQMAELTDKVLELEAQIEKMKWHKIADGDFPKDDKLVLVYREDEEPQLDCYLNEEEYWKSEKWDMEYYARKGETPPVSSIVAWKEIVLPEEIKEK